MRNHVELKIKCQDKRTPCMAYYLHLIIYESFKGMKTCNIVVGWCIVFNATFNNISVISWRSILLMEETRVPGENHRLVTNIVERKL